MRGASYPQCCDAGGRGVEADVALGLVKRLLWNALVISAPVLGAALAVGLAISVLQVATQLQEMTLTYVPKMLVVVLALIALGPWMLHQLTQFATAMMRLCSVPALPPRVTAHPILAPPQHQGRPGVAVQARDQDEPPGAIGRQHPAGLGA